MLRGKSKKGKGRAGGKKEERVALEIRTSLRPERPGTTPEGDRNKERTETRGRRREQTTRTCNRTETAKGRKQTQTIRRDRSTNKARQETEEPQCNSAKSGGEIHRKGR